MKVPAQGEARGVRAPWSHRYCRYWSAGAMLLLRSVSANRRSASQPKRMQRSSSVKASSSRFRVQLIPALTVRVRWLEENVELNGVPG